MRQATFAGICAIVVGIVFGPAVCAHPAWGIVVSPAGDVYFSDLETVWRVDHRGRLSIVRPGVTGHHVHELAIDAEGNIYGPEYTYLSESEGYTTGIWEMDASGRIHYQFRPTQHLPRGVSIWRDVDGSMYSVEEDNHLKRQTLLIKRATNGKVSVFAGSEYGFNDGAGAHARFSNVVGIAFGPDRYLYITDSDSLRKVSAGGVVTTIAAHLNQFQPRSVNVLSFGSLMGVAVTASKTAYVADFRNRRVLKISANGAVSVVITEQPPWSPTGVAVSKDGELFVLEFGFRPPGTWIKPRVRKISPNGQNSTIATVP